MNSGKFKTALGFLSGLIGLMMIIAVWFYRQDLVRIFKQLDACWFGAGLATYYLNYGFRAFRLRVMTGSKIGFVSEALNFSCLHGMLSYFFPFRTGDVSLPLLLKSTGRVTFKKGVLILFKTRLMDISALGCLSLLGAVWGARQIPEKIQLIWILAGIAMIAAFPAFLLVLHYAKNLLIRYMRDISDDSGKVTVKLTESLLTLGVWTSVCLSQFCMVRSVGLHLSLSEVLFITTIQFPLQLLPVQGVANSGNHEGGWVSALALMGFNLDLAVSYALASHAVSVIYVAALSLPLFLSGVYSKSRRHQTQDPKP